MTTIPEAFGKDTEMLVGFISKYDNALFKFERNNNKLVKKRIFETHEDPSLKDICKELEIPWGEKSPEVITFFMEGEE
jgi:hypothetical protein